MPGKPIKTDIDSADLTSVALQQDYTVEGYDEELLAVYLKASENITETVTVSIISVLDTTNRIYLLDTASLAGAQNYRFRPSTPEPLKKGDVVRLACTNGNTTGTAYGEIRVREAN